jgi:hypothetical protein
LCTLTTAVAWLFAYLSGGGRGDCGEGEG